MSRYFFLLFLLFSCKVHEKHTAIYNQFTVVDRLGQYVQVISPSTNVSLNHKYFSIYYPNRVQIGDKLTLTNMNNNKLYVVELSSSEKIYVVASSEGDARFLVSKHNAKRNFGGPPERILSLKILADSEKFEVNTLLLH